MPLIDSSTKQSKLLNADKFNIKVTNSTSTDIECDFWFEANIIECIKRKQQQVRLSVQTTNPAKASLPSSSLLGKIGLTKTNPKLTVGEKETSKIVDLTNYVPNTITRNIQKIAGKFEPVYTDFNVAKSYNTAWLKLELLDFGGKPVEELVVSFSPLKLLGEFQKPLMAPVINHYRNYNNDVVLFITQKDINGKEIGIYKHVDGSIATKIKQFSASFGHVEKITDTPVNQLKTIYYAVAIGEGGVVGQEFGKVVLNPNLIGGLINSKATLVTEISKQGITLIIGSISDSTTKVVVEKRTKNTTVESVEKFYLSPKTTRVDDTKVVDGLIYEYSLSEITNRGNILAGPCAQETFHKQTVGKASVAISEISTSDSDISFTIQTTKLPSNLSLVRVTGGDSIFTSSLSAMTDVGFAYVHEIKRSNLQTGEIISLGRFVDSKFVDSSVSDILGIEGIKPNTVYKYRITTHVVDPSTIFDGSTAVTPKGVTFSTKKWKNPYTTKTGVLVSNESFLSNHAAPLEYYGEICSIVEQTIKTSQEQTTIGKVSVTSNEEYVEIGWTVVGNPRSIESFELTGVSGSLSQKIGEQLATEELTYKFRTKQKHEQYVIKAYSSTNTSEVLIKAETGKWLHQ